MKNILKISLLVMAVPALCINAAAQKHSFKAYAGLDFSKKQTLISDPGGNYVFESTLRTTYLTGPVIAYDRITKKGSFHEIQLQGASFENRKGKDVFTDSLGIQQSLGNFSLSQLRVGYEYNQFLYQTEDSKWTFFMGANLGQSYTYRKSESMVQTSFPTTIHIYTAAISLVPRIQYSLKEKWYLDLNFNYEVYSLKATSHKVKNPALTSAQQKSSQVTQQFDLVPSHYILRFGIGYNL